MEALIENVKRGTVLKATEANLFSIRFDDASPKRAQKIVQAFLTVFIESNLGESRSDMEKAQKFLRDQNKIYREKLEASEKRLAEFRQKYGNLMPKATNAARAHFQKAKEDLNDKKVQRAGLQEQLAKLEPFIVYSGDRMRSGIGPPTGTEFQIVELEDAIQKLLTRYTEKYPDVLVARRRLQALREKLKVEQNSRADFTNDKNEGSASGRREPNPIYESIKAQLIATEIDIKISEDRILRLKKEWEKIEQKVKMAPFLVAELTKLNRDYGILKVKYAQLSASRETAKITEQRNIKAEKVRFRIIDPPTMAIKPHAPNRPLLLTVVLIFGLGAGVGITLLLIVGDDSIANIRVLKSSFSIPVLGFVRDQSMGGGKKLVDYFGLCLAGGGLLTVFVGLLAIEFQIGLSNISSLDVLRESILALESILVDNIVN
jgi:polysaccharide chain length determinant protein (PEP-CTERM system associated)